MENTKILKVVRTILVDLAHTGRINCESVSSLSQVGIDDSFSDLGVSINEMVTIFSSIKQRFWEIDGVTAPPDCLIDIPVESAGEMRIVQDLLTAIEREIFQIPPLQVIEKETFYPFTEDREQSCPCSTGQ